MKKIVIASLILICSIAQAQNFQGMAVYESKTSTADFMKGMSGNRDMTPEMQKQIEERMKKMFERTFVLNFDKSASIYKEEEKLDEDHKEEENLLEKEHEEEDKALEIARILKELTGLPLNDV